MERLCTARTHSTYAYDRYGCRCPEVVERIRGYRQGRRRLLPRGHRSPGRQSDLDPIAVDRSVGGEFFQLTVPELRTAIGELTDAGMSARDIALRLHCTARTVTRHRAALREMADAA